MNPKNANVGITAGRLKPVPLYLEVAELLRQRIFKRNPDDLEPGSWIDELKLAHLPVDFHKACNLAHV